MMWKPARMITRNSRILLTAVVVLAMSSCMQTPEEKLLGRWYNDSLSIRFRKDGSVLYNSPSGRAIGRYYFDPRAKNPAKTDPVPNLVLDVVRKERHLRLSFEVEQISEDRVRLTYFPSLEEARSGTRLPSSILLRADESKTTVAATTP